MTYLNKLGLFLLFIGSQNMPPSDDWHGVLMLLFTVGGASMWLYTPEARLTKRAPDLPKAGESSDDHKSASG